MRFARQLTIPLACLTLVLAAACKPAAASTSLAPVDAPVTLTAVPTASQESASPSPTARATTSPVTSPTRTSPTSLPSPSPSPSPTPCGPDICTYASQFFLARPIAPPGNDAVDVTYRFGSTQSGRRDPHHGVEFLNGFGTPVLAAADGTVVTAGDDRQPTSPQGDWPITFYGPYMYFYGNLVVIEHDTPPALRTVFPDIPGKVYTLYGHLSEILVEVGQQVQTGQQIGKVGMSGIAEGSHLHFEVRLDENTYESVRNPELWLAPHRDETDQPLGALAGRFIDSYGNSLAKDSIVLQHLPNGPDGPSDFEVTLLTYEEEALLGQAPWEESFAVGDIPSGLYRISFPHFGLRQELVQVYPGQLTVVTFK